MDYINFKKTYEYKEVIEQTNAVASNPLVTVCVQTYQHSKFIEECLDSILMQKTNFDFEINLGEDASTDGTREICIEYAKKFPNKIRLFLHHRENNIAIDGSPTGRFVLLTNLFSSRGKYIALCEGDDYWTDPYKLQKQVDFLENNPDFVLTHHDAKIVNENGDILNNSKLPKKYGKDYSAAELKKGPFLLTLSLCFRNKLKKYPAEMFECLNGDKWLISLLGDYGKAKYLPEIDSAAYRTHPGGIWSLHKNVSKHYNLFNTFTQLGIYYNKKGEIDLVYFFNKRSRNEMYKVLQYYRHQNNYRKFMENLKFYYKSSKDSIWIKNKTILRSLLK